jgi:hypothetical protein
MKGITEVETFTAQSLTLCHFLLPSPTHPLSHLSLPLSSLYHTHTHTEQEGRGTEGETFTSQSRLLCHLLLSFPMHSLSLSLSLFPSLFLSHIYTHTPPFLPLSFYGQRKLPTPSPHVHVVVSVPPPLSSHHYTETAVAVPLTPALPSPFTGACNAARGHSVRGEVVVFFPFLLAPSFRVPPFSTLSFPFISPCNKTPRVLREECSRLSCSFRKTTRTNRRRCVFSRCEGRGGL